MQLVEVKYETFKLKNRTSRLYGPHIIELGDIVLKVILAEMLIKKADRQYASSFGLESSWEGYPDSIKQATLDCIL